MFKLSAQHLEEIAGIPQLMELVDNGVVPDAHMKPFVQLCVDHCCAQTFLEICKAGPLNVLAQHNGVKLAQQLDFSKEHRKAWKRAARHAGVEGHLEFAQYILTQCDSDEIRKSVITGACMGDKVDLVKRFAPTIEDPDFASHLPPLAAQLNAVECMRYLVMSAKTWMSAMAVAAVDGHPHLIDVLMDHVPVDCVPPRHWCQKVATRVVGTPGDQRLLGWIFHHITDQEIIKFYPRMPLEKQEILTSAYQRVVLASAIDDVARATHKRKM